jgi:mycothiol synthase
MNPLITAAFRQHLSRLVGGRHPDRRTQLELGRLHLEDYQRYTHGARLLSLLQDLPWESRVLRRPCWQLHLGVAPAAAGILTNATSNANNSGLIWTRIAAEHHAAMAALRLTHFEPVVEMRNLQLRGRSLRIQALPVDPRVRQARRNEAPALAQLARRMFTADRFHSDPAIPARLADEAHAEWVRNSVLGRVADETLVVVDRGRLAGFHALKWLNTTRGRVGMTVLIGVSPSRQGRGLGKILLTAGLQRLRDGGAIEIWIRTEATNSAANALYESFGFVETGRFWYLRKDNP